MVGAQGCKSCQEQGAQKLEPGEEQIEIVADGGEHGVDGIAAGMGEVVSVHAVLVFGMANHGFDGRAAFEVSLDGLGQAALLIGDIDFELLMLGGVVAPVAGIDDDLIQTGTDHVLDIGDHGCQGMAVIGIAGHGLGVNHELPALAAVERGGDRDLHAKFIRFVSLALADAFDFRGMQGIDLVTTLAPALILDPPGQRQGISEQGLQALLMLARTGDLAGDVADRPTQDGAQPA